MSLFCCDAIKPYKPQRIDHEAKFREFLACATLNDTSQSTNPAEDLANADYVVQLVRQVNYGPLESKRYFAHTPLGYKEVSEKDLINANFKKLNTYKNYRCQMHNRFFEINVYQKDPNQTHTGEQTSTGRRATSICRLRTVRCGLSAGAQFKRAHMSVISYRSKSMRRL